MAKSEFVNGSDALAWFRKSLTERQLTIASEEKVATKSGKGRFVYPIKIETTSREVFIVKYWNEKWIPSTRISNFARDLDERYRFAINTFGNEDASATSMNADLLVKLLELDEKGYDCYVVTIYSCGEVLFCSAREMYEFATRYGTLQQYTSDPYLQDALSLRVPTGWLKRWTEVESGPPAIGCL